MDQLSLIPRITVAAAGALLLWGMVVSLATAEECENRGNADADFGECRVLVEINSTDGDIGFHWLTDADDLNSTRIDDPDGAKTFENGAFGPLREQKLTETFGESAEPLCWPSPDLEEDEEPVTLTDFRDIWEPGTYAVRGKGDEGEKLDGEAELTYYLPAAPRELWFDGSVISWESGNDLGNCAPSGDEDSVQFPALVPTATELFNDGILAALPAEVPVIAWEVVLEPEVDETDPRANLKFSTRVAGPGMAVPSGMDYMLTVPAEYLAALGADTPIKIEIGAIGGDFAIVGGEVVGRMGRPVDDDNATFTEFPGEDDVECTVQGCVEVED